MRFVSFRPLAFSLLAVSFAAACTSEPTGSPLRIPDAGFMVDANDNEACDGGARACGDICCGAGEVCSATTECCPRDMLCGNVCCGAGQVCEGAVCHTDCGSNTRCQNATDGEICCAENEVCALDRCFLPTQSCTDFYDCPSDQYCEITLGQCLPAPGGEECIAEPIGGDVVPTLLWKWEPESSSDAPNSASVMVTPIVANLTDDNEDGVVNHFDTPDVVFTSSDDPTWDGPGVLRVVSGDTGDRIFSLTTPSMDPESPVAVADIDNDGLPEIVGCVYNTRYLPGDLIALSNTGAIKWRTSDARVRCGGTGPSIADIDQDGHPEVIVNYTVINGEDGSVAWSHECVNAPNNNERANYPCAFTTAANLDDDEELEVVGGNIAYNHDGSVYFDRSADLTDGYPAIADLDLDGLPEIVVVQSGFIDRMYTGDHYLYVLDHTGNTLQGPLDVHQGHAPSSAVIANTLAGGGPPTIANFDEDPEPEIALATGYGYAIFEGDGTPKWFAPTVDASSRKTGSSVFDFDGDGIAEAVYNDEYWLRVFDGRTGEVRYCECNTTGTLWEYPVIADVNNDNHAEIVVVSNTLLGNSCPSDRDLDECTMARIAAGETEGTDGVRLFGGPLRDWVRSRRIWNQHSYHVTNINEDGTVPTHETPNWTTPGLNNFRSNAQPGASNAPDLILTDLSVDISSCPSAMVLNVRVRNDGWSGSLPNIPVTAYAETAPGVYTRIGRAFTTRVLLPGDSEVLDFPYDVSGRDPGVPLRFRAVINDSSDLTSASLRECRGSNNEGEVEGSCSVLF